MRAKQIPGQKDKPSLPIRQAFVVQFRAGVDFERKQITGRVEHIVSGRVALFDSAEELLTFFTQTLSTQISSARAHQ